MSLDPTVAADCATIDSVLRLLDHCAQTLESHELQPRHAKAIRNTAAGLQQDIRAFTDLLERQCHA